MLIENQYQNFGIVNGTIDIIYEIILNHDIARNDTSFIKPPLHVLVDFNYFIDNHNYSLNNINDITVKGLLKNISSTILISKKFKYTYKVIGFII